MGIQDRDYYKEKLDEIEKNVNNKDKKFYFFLKLLIPIIILGLLIKFIAFK